MNVKDKIRGYRTMLGLNQSEMGKALGISKQSYYNKENGKVAFSDSEKMVFKKMLEPYFSDITLEDIFFLNKKYSKVFLKCGKFTLIF